MQGMGLCDEILLMGHTSHARLSGNADESVGFISRAGEALERRQCQSDHGQSQQMSGIFPELMNLNGHRAAAKANQARDQWIG